VLNWYNVFTVISLISERKVLNWCIVFTVISLILDLRGKCWTDILCSRSSHWS
jgi:hypothetical protein